MKDTLKNKIRFSSTLFPETEKKLKDYSEKSGVPISKILDNAINYYIDSQKNPTQKFLNPPPGVKK